MDLCINNFFLLFSLLAALTIPSVCIHLPFAKLPTISSAFIDLTALSAYSIVINIRNN